jgi:periplasmic divalent cation tolerance protein
MLESTSSARIVLTTAAHSDEANRMARTLIEEQLAACATLFPAVESIYRWKGKTETSVETMLLLKTGAGQLAALEARLHQLHSYETPEFLVLSVEAGSQAYLAWMSSGLIAPGAPDASNSKPVDE